MMEIAKWAWILLLITLFFGYWVFVILAADVLIYFLIRWLRPEWLKNF